jgi:hypothetical protein
MMSTRAALMPLLFALAVAQSPAQAQAPDVDPKDALQQLLSNALSITITARVVPPDAQQDEASIWNAESTKLTISGRAIKVRLDGDNVRIFLICTPYVQEDGSVLLLAQGQVWFTEPDDQESKLYNTFYTIPVTFGEPVLFFPLGVSDTAQPQNDYFNIEVEIRIVPYEQKQ